MSEQRTFGGFEQHQRHFERVLRDVLADEPEGLHAHELRERVREHPRFNVDLDPQEFMAWLDEASAEVVIRDLLDPWTYRTPGCPPDREEAESEAGADA